MNIWLSAPPGHQHSSSKLCQNARNGGKWPSFTCSVQTIFASTDAICAIQNVLWRNIYGCCTWGSCSTEKGKGSENTSRIFILRFLMLEPNLNWTDKTVLAAAKKLPPTQNVDIRFVLCIIFTTITTFLAKITFCQFQHNLSSKISSGQRQKLWYITLKITGSK